MLFGTILTKMERHNHLLQRLVIEYHSTVSIMTVSLTVQVRITGLYNKRLFNLNLLFSFGCIKSYFSNIQ